MKVPSPVRLLIFVALVVGVSTVSYFLIERPLSRLRFTRSGLRAAEPTLPAPVLVGSDEPAIPLIKNP